MNKAIKSVFASVMVLALLLGASNAWAQESRLAEGSRVYGNACGWCHNARSPLERTDREWTAIANHMRIRGNLTGGQLRAVLAFLQATNNDPREIQAPSAEMLQRELRMLEFSDEVPTDPAAIETGRQLVAEKACVGCHVIGDEGGAVGPALNDVITRRGAQFVRQKLTDPTFDNESSMMPNFGLSAEEIDALVAYLATYSSGS